ncbi:WLM domain-containing protein [Thozetella sp. PMI_491]|nr:WLM domain-containing protein [Thozetella sp. PMI_491]
MPIGIQRLNAKKSHPNDRIVFIKPLNGPDEAVAKDFLERIAAQCLPIIREHHLSVMSLEEYEPNSEFLGRNFNAGEVIQLVLKARSGRWLSFHEVQLVMMHELAHCKQMNHSRAFWDVRNTYAKQMESLWARSYTGEGLWGRGALLRTGDFEWNTAQPGEGVPAHLCGGTYRSRRRKRKAKQSLSYQEQKERRILKRFGPNGVALGDDEVVKRRLEKGQTNSARPRVAGSKRGRELRAAAALARFDKQKREEVKTPKVKAGEASEEQQGPTKQEDPETASDDSADSDDDYEDAEPEAADAVDINGVRLLDGKGRSMVKVCEDEDPDDEEARNELASLRSSARKQQDAGEPSSQKQPGLQQNSEKSLRPQTPDTAPKKDGGTPDATKLAPVKDSARDQMKAGNRLSADASQPDPPTQVSSPPGPAQVICQICSFANERRSATCAMCANVLDPGKMPSSWSCQSQDCQGSAYVNAGDCGVCGVCGQRRRSE